MVEHSERPAQRMHFAAEAYLDHVMGEMNMEHYLDNAATTKPCAEAAAAVMSCISSHYGNPSSLHRKGLEAQHEMEYARNQLAGALGCKPQEIVFTSGATESTNLALCGAAAAYGRKRKKIITSAVEHASVKETMAHLETLGFQIVQVCPDGNGIYHAEDFLREADKDTCLISIMLVNNENGYRMPVEDVFRILKRRDPEIITHCDAVQGFLKIPFKTRTLCADLVSVSGHKVHALKGAGALYVRHGVRLKPVLFGSHQEKGLRPGTESVPLIAAFGAAAEKLASTTESRYTQVSALRSSLIAQLREMEDVVIREIPGASPYVLNFSLLGYRSEIVLHFLEQRGVFVSSGSACSKGASSGVLETFGAKPAEVDSALRISFCAENTEEDIAALVQGLKEAQKELMH